MIRSHDIRCNPADCLGLTVCDTIRRNHERLVTLRASRAASFFGEARAARDDIAYGAYPTLLPRLTAPVFRNGEVIDRVPVRIIGKTIPGAYIVQGIHGGPQWIAFTGEIHTL